MAFQEDLEKEVPGLISGISGVDVPDEYKTLATVCTLILLFYGADFLYQKYVSKTFFGRTRQQLESLIEELSSTLGVPKEKIRKVLENNYSSRRVASLAKAAISFFSPATRHQSTSIVVGKHRIEPDLISEIPSDIDIEESKPDEISESYQGVEIELHAQDLDRAKSGWAGIVRNVVDRRIKMDIYPPIKPEDIYRRGVVKGDIILVSRQQDSGRYEPYKFHLIRVRE